MQSLGLEFSIVGFDIIRPRCRNMCPGGCVSFFRSSWSAMRTRYEQLVLGNLRRYVIYTMHLRQSSTGTKLQCTKPYGT